MEKNINKSLIKIAVTGPESTGKTTLAENLALRFNSLLVPEYARDYIDNLKTPYNKQDVENIAKGQLKSIKDIEKHADKLIICDTELIVIKIWLDVKYGECPQWILNEVQKQNFDLYLLCYPDIPWVYDKQREHPNLREYLFNLYENELQKNNFNYHIIKGNIEERMSEAYKKINKLIS